MKEIIIAGLVMLLIFFAYAASQTGKTTSHIQPASLPVVEEKASVISHRQSEEQYYAIITEEIIEEEVMVK